MIEQRWDKEAVARRLEEAADVLARLPEERVRGFYDLWPRIVGEPCQTPGLAAAAPEAIDRMDEALGWLCWLEPEERRLVWLRAEGLPWKRITHRLGIGRTTAWQRWTMALLKIAIRLNAAAEQNRPNIKPLNRSGRFCARKRLASDEVREAPPVPSRVEISPPGMAAAGFCLCGVAVARQAARAPSAGVQERGGGEARSWTGSGRARRAGATVPAGAGPGPRTWRATRCALPCQAAGRVVPATVVDHVVPHRGDPVLFWDEGNWARLCKRCHDAKTAREGRWG